MGTSYGSQPSTMNQPHPSLSTHILANPMLCGDKPFVARELSLNNLKPSAWATSAWRRLLDVMVAMIVLAVGMVPMLLIGLCIRLTSAGPVLFAQERVGRGGGLFRVYKFRSMTVRASTEMGPGLTRDGDSRITRVGRWLRKLKLDEIPQFYNVLRGEMSLVGPRPKLPRYEALTNMPFTPGITGAATLVFRHEEELLREIRPQDLDAYYAEHIQPLKAQLDSRYMCRATLQSDLQLIGYTFLSCVVPSMVLPALRGIPPALAANRTALAVDRTGSTIARANMVN